MKYLLAAACAAAMCVSAPAFAADANVDTYGTVGIDTLNSGGYNFRALSGRLGFRGEHFGVEAEAAFGIADTDVGGVDVKVKNDLGLYAVAYLPGGDNVDLFARGGYGRTEFEASAGGGAASADDTSWRAGVGGQWFWNGGANGLRFDVTHAWYDAGGDSDTVSLAFVHKFGK
jgi:CubicO group peptidase (beta-lactamase class C family)